MTTAPTPSPAEASPAETARRVMRRCDRAALATAQADAAGWPLPSLVLVGFDLDAAPLLLVSDLAEHARNIKADDRLGLLFDGTAGLAEPLTGPRVSVLGRAEPAEEPRLAERYLARHPGARFYAGFGDFRFLRVRIERAHLVAGFGRIHWIDGRDILLPRPLTEGLAQSEAGIVEHMNEDHADAVDLYANELLGRGGEGWRMVGIDPEGCDLRREAELARLEFDTPVTDPKAARTELVRLVNHARSRRA
ncbi:HugZ family pyridoxamine 5'-phosphate oxidase [Arenibaculum pallidiluteum]|uniref:HugZ family pyridoxamine 5'-phosphate oxidase n=1 Tax=Arenibaculum pallidiluteum TaxID=2812559 RepID=UPI001A97483A|nr:DUF2470 domain-containing protein [Arenibaculum pallidiluteum]